jgi:nanoRNase/pAp phosphatase (c-di-AMP/oligoRNAs hydrolase)
MDPLPYSFEAPLGQLDRLREVLGPGPVLILTHDNPDPDALASGVGLAQLFHHGWGLRSRLVYSGLVARAENRTMLRLLTPEWEPGEDPLSAGVHSAIVLVDTQPEAGNNRLKPGVTPQVVFDHHLPKRKALQQVPFQVVAPKVGATVSLVYAYLDAAGVKLDRRLSTAMFYGLKTDTRGLSRGASSLDEAVYIRLLAGIDRRLLTQVEQSGLSREYFRAFSQGLTASQIYGQSLITNLGTMQWPDLTAEMADLLIRFEDANVVLCQGIFKQMLFFSVRTKPMTWDAGLLVQKMIFPPGKAGGHGSMAGGQIPLAEADPQSLQERLKDSFLQVMGEAAAAQPLILP